MLCLSKAVLIFVLLFVSAVVITGHSAGHHSGITEADHVRIRDSLQGQFDSFLFTETTSLFLRLSHQISIADNESRSAIHPEKL